MSRPPRISIARCSLLLPLAMAGLLVAALMPFEAGGQVRAVKRANPNRPQQNQPGKPAEPSMLVNVPRLVTAYYSETPDPAEPDGLNLMNTGY